jgi:trk system potassium uptake protein TrkA
MGNGKPADRRRVAVIGLGRFGESAALTMAEIGYEVTAIDVDERAVARVADRVTLAAQGDGTDQDLLTSLAIDRSEVAIVGVGTNLDSSVLATLQLKKLGVPRVIAKAETLLHGEVLTRIGADRIVYPERAAGARVAHAIFVNDVEEYISLSRTSGIAKLPLPPEYAGRAAGEVCHPGGKLVLLLIQRGGRILPSPGPAEILELSDEVVVAGEDALLAAFSEAPDPGRTTP